MTELADLTAQSRSRLSHQITRMEAKGLVRREGCEGDKRGTFAVITPHGQAIIERGRPVPRGQRPAALHRPAVPRAPQALTDAYEPVLNRLRKVRDRD